MTPQEDFRPGMYGSDIEEFRGHFGDIKNALGRDAGTLESLVAQVGELVRGDAAGRELVNRVGQATAQVITRVEQLTGRTEQLAGVVERLLAGLGERDEALVRNLVSELTSKLGGTQQQNKAQDKGAGRGEAIAQITSKIDTTANALASGQADLTDKVGRGLGDLKGLIKEVLAEVKKSGAASADAAPAAVAPAAAAPPAPPAQPAQPAQPKISLAQAVDAVLGRFGKQVKERKTTPQGRRLFLVGRVWVVEIGSGLGRKSNLREMLLGAVEEVDGQRGAGEAAVVCVPQVVEDTLAAEPRLAVEAGKRRVFVVSPAYLEGFIRAANTGGSAAGVVTPGDLTRLEQLVVSAGKSLRELPNSEGSRSTLAEILRTVGKLKERLGGEKGEAQPDGGAAREGGAEAEPARQESTRTPGPPPQKGSAEAGTATRADGDRAPAPAADGAGPKKVGPESTAAPTAAPSAEPARERVAAAEDASPRPAAEVAHQPERPAQSKDAAAPLVESGEQGARGDKGKNSGGGDGRQGAVAAGGSAQAEEVGHAAGEAPAQPARPRPAEAARPAEASTKEDGASASPSAAGAERPQRAEKSPAEGDAEGQPSEVAPPPGGQSLRRLRQQTGGSGGGAAPPRSSWQQPAAAAGGAAQTSGSESST